MATNTTSDDATHGTRATVLDSSSSPSPGGQIPVHRCHLCNRSYERADHLNRHLKSHENARPYRCTKCPKSFNRADLLNRHHASHERYANSNKTLRVSRYDRVATACNGCVLSKSKCQEQKPCLRCVSRKIPCSFQQSRAYLEPAIQSGNVTCGNSNAKDTELSPVSQASVTHEGLEIENVPVDEHLDYLTLNGSHASILDTNMRNSNLTSGVLVTNPGDYNDIYNNGFPLFNQNLGLSLDESFLPWNLDFGQDMDFGMYEIDLEGVDFENSMSSNGEIEDKAFSKTKTRINAPITHKKNFKGYAAFERSPWLWTPTSNDQTLNDLEHISLNEGSIPAAFEPASPGASILEFSHCSINTRTRDDMLSLVVSLPKVITRNISFPSLALLNTVIQVYFAQESGKADTFIHSALESTKALPHLMIAIVAGGSIFISTPAIWKMGLALQEIVRHTVADFWEQNNSNTRNLQSLQAFMIFLDVGLWCGFKRKMEIAESFSQPMMTILRRAGAFSEQHNSLATAPREDDSEGLLELKWRKWAELESFKRLILHLFFHDIHASAALQKPPLMTITELRFGLPASRELWMAKTATEWRKAFLAHVPQLHKKTTFMDILEDPDLLHTLKDYIDIHLCTVVLLHGYWHQIWALAESKSFYPASKTTHRLSLLTTHRELYRDLLDLADKIPSLTQNSPVATLLSEFFMMVLHVSLADLQRFAGKFGEDEARNAHVLLQAWCQTTESRAAIWHAGQVLRAAQNLLPTQLTGFNAIALYYSSLALWVYGLVVSSHPNSSNTIASGRQRGVQPFDYSISTAPVFDVILNCHETTQIISFKANGREMPGVLSVKSSPGADVFIPLKDTDRILRNSRDIYKSNFPASDDPLPSLVVNLVNLLKDLECCRSNLISRAASETAD